MGNEGLDGGKKAYHLAARKHIRDGQDHIADLPNTCVSWVSHTDHRPRGMLVRELIPNATDGTGKRITDDPRARRDEYRVADNVRSCREVHDLASSIHGQDRVDVVCVVRRTITVDRNPLNRLHINNIICSKLFVCWRLHGKIVLSTSDKCLGTVGRSLSPIVMFDVRVAGRVLQSQSASEQYEHFPFISLPSFHAPKCSQRFQLADPGLPH